MDVGTIVENSGLYASVFALLACVALAVELGRRPPKPKNMFVADEETTVEAGQNTTATKPDDTTDSKPHTKPHTKPSVEIPSRAFGSPVLQQTTVEPAAIPEIPFDQLQPTVVGAFDFAAERKAALAQDNLLVLQRTYVDGFLSPRGKYDVALAILNEYQVSSTIAVAENAGQTMATEAYLSATRTGTITTEREPFLAGLMKTMMTPPAEYTADDTKQKQTHANAKEKSEPVKRDTSNPDKSKQVKSKPNDVATSAKNEMPRTERKTTERRKPSSNRMRNRNTKD